MTADGLIMLLPRRQRRDVARELRAVEAARSGSLLARLSGSGGHTGRCPPGLVRAPVLA